MKLIITPIKRQAILLFKIIFYTPLKYILLSLVAAIVVLIYGNSTWWGKLLRQGLPLICSLAIFILISRELWSNRSKLNFVVKIYLKSGILTYHRYLRKFKDEAKAQEAGVRASTADHAIYNAILITLSVAIVLLAQ